MFQKILYHLDKKHFGNQILIYKGYYEQNDIYFVAVTDRGESAYFCVDSNLEKMFPVNSYVDHLELDIDFNNIQDFLDFTIDIDLSKYGYSKCSPFIAKLISENK